MQVPTSANLVVRFRRHNAATIPSAASTVSTGQRPASISVPLIVDMIGVNGSKVEYLIPGSEARYFPLDCANGTNMYDDPAIASRPMVPSRTALASSVRRSEINIHMMTPVIAIM